ncbi:hypothetical protein FOZ63_005481, partial [Perkinsus olseni]
AMQGSLGYARSEITRLEQSNQELTEEVEKYRAACELSRTVHEVEQETQEENFKEEMGRALLAKNLQIDREIRRADRATREASILKAHFYSGESGVPDYDPSLRQALQEMEAIDAEIDKLDPAYATWKNRIKCLRAPNGYVTAEDASAGGGRGVHRVIVQRDRGGSSPVCVRNIRWLPSSVLSVVGGKPRHTNDIEESTTRRWPLTDSGTTAESVRDVEGSTGCLLNGSTKAVSELSCGNGQIDDDVLRLFKENQELNGKEGLALNKGSIEPSLARASRGEENLCEILCSEIAFLERKLQRSE